MDSEHVETEPDTWAGYIEGETERLLAEAGPDLVLAFIHSRAIESPEHYAKSRQMQKDLASTHFGITKAGYWEKIALRALVLLNVPIEIREQLIEEARLRNEEARAKLRAKIKQGPGGPYKERTGEVDLSQLRL